MITAILHIDERVTVVNLDQMTWMEEKDTGDRTYTTINFSGGTSIVVDETMPEVLRAVAE